MTWTDGVTASWFRDYTLRLPDVNGHGGLVRLSFNLNENIAHFCVRLDDENGEEYFDNETEGGTSVPLTWANAIASGVDGYTMTPTPEEN